MTAERETVQSKQETEQSQEDSLDALFPGVLHHNAVLVEGSGDWVLFLLLLFFLLSLGGLGCSLSLLGCLGVILGNRLGLGSLGLLALLLNLGQDLLLQALIPS